MNSYKVFFTTIKSQNIKKIIPSQIMFDSHLLATIIGNVKTESMDSKNQKFFLSICSEFDIPHINSIAIKYRVVNANSSNYTPYSNHCTSFSNIVGCILFISNNYNPKKLNQEDWGNCFQNNNDLFDFILKTIVLLIVRLDNSPIQYTRGKKNSIVIDLYRDYINESIKLDIYMMRLCSMNTLIDFSDRLQISSQMYIKDVKIERNSFDNNYTVFINHCSLHISIKYDVFYSSYIIRYYDIDEKLINNWEIDDNYRDGVIYNNEDWSGGSVFLHCTSQTTLISYFLTTSFVFLFDEKLKFIRIFEMGSTKSLPNIFFDDMRFIISEIVAFSNHIVILWTKWSEDFYSKIGVFSLDFEHICNIFEPKNVTSIKHTNLYDNLLLLFVDRKYTCEYEDDIYIYDIMTHSLVGRCKRNFSKFNNKNKFILNNSFPFSNILPSEYICKLNKFNFHLKYKPFKLPCGNSACWNCICDHINLITGTIKCNFIGSCLENHILTKNLEIDNETTSKMKNDCEKISKFYLNEGQRVVDNIVSIEVIENTFRFIEEEMDCRLESLKISVDDSREKFLKIFNSKIRKYTRKFHSNIINKPRLEDFGILKHPIF